MVLTLQELCLFTIRDSIENGQRPPADKLPPPLRQRIFDTILKHGTLNNRECIDLLGSTEYLNGFTSINTNTQYGEIDDSDFLERAAESIGQINSGTSIGEGIERLDLRIHANDANSANIVRLISKCPNLKSLHVDMRSGCHVLNQSAASDPCRSVLENVNDLSFATRNVHYERTRYFALRNDPPFLEFRSLTSLKLKSCLVNVVAWRKLLETTRNTLQIIRAIDVETIDDKGEYVKDWILPFAMPQLTHIEYRGRSFHVDQTLPVRLIECGALVHIHVQVILNNDFTNVELETLSAVQQSIKSVDITVVLQAWRLVHQTKAIIDKFFNQLGPNVKSLHMLCGDVDICVTAIGQCTNLEQLTWQSVNEAGMEASRCLINLFRDLERAERLRKLSLLGNYDHFVLDALFENCRHLQKLSIFSCSKLIDEHLIVFATRCHALKTLDVGDCENISDGGLMSILIAGGSRLKRVRARGSAKITEKTWMTMIDHCPNVVEISEISEELEEARRRKSFYRFVDVLQY